MNRFIENEQEISEKETIEFCMSELNEVSNTLSAFERYLEIDRKRKSKLYIPKQAASFEYLDDFEKIGKKIRAEPSVPTITEMEALADSIYEGKYEHDIQASPLFIVCGPSGTGKTQLPFSLDRPILYFTQSHDLSIYSLFKNISDFFWELLEYDFELFAKEQGIVDRYIDKNSYKYSLDKFNTAAIAGNSSFKYSSLGFLVELIRKVNDLKNGKCFDLSWPRIQLTLSETIPCSLLTISETQIQLKSILENEQLEKLPLIFLDKFNALDSHPSLTKAKYFFLRNVIRVANLIPVLIGSNSDMKYMTTAKERNECENKVWAFVFHKFPSYPASLLTESVEKYFIPGEPFVPVLITLLQRENPFFAKLVLGHLEKISKNSHIKLSEDNFPVFFDDILKIIFEGFISREKTFLEFLYRRQILFFGNSSRILSNTLYSEKYPKRNSGRSVFIEFHLAQLELPKNILLNPDQKTWFEIYTSKGNSAYKCLSSSGKLDYKEFEVSSVFPLFIERPLSCMALSMNFDRNHCPFIDSDRRYTAFQALSNAQAGNKMFFFSPCNNSMAPILN